ncbi:hypothetical protein GYMLUDRAFT_264719 [Collybiopsis luxurians FD-317 M1]|uniref:Uncharacterized protein n=1 Tax=Collybiopsis luxurians FD-317 M1 TaxID=944289 RepID=A0A0D0BHN7_9AGAR|nr:hypothetical protein GYMLUDRAFT_264719 [Collybiopsis luxurians FD-317 M1]
MWEGGSLSLAQSVIVVIGQADLVLPISSVLINPSLSSSSARITRAISTLLHTDPSPSTSAFTSDTDSNTIRICSSLPISYDCGKLILPRRINNFCGALSSAGTRIHEANSSFFVIRRQKLVSFSLNPQNNHRPYPLPCVLLLRAHISMLRISIPVLPGLSAQKPLSLPHPRPPWTSFAMNACHSNRVKVPCVRFSGRLLAMVSSVCSLLASLSHFGLRVQRFLARRPARQYLMLRLQSPALFMFRHGEEEALLFQLPPAPSSRSASYAMSSSRRDELSNTGVVLLVQGSLVCSDWCSLQSSFGRTSTLMVEVIDHPQTRRPARAVIWLMYLVDILDRCKLIFGGSTGGALHINYNGGYVVLAKPALHPSTMPTIWNDGREGTSIHYPHHF